MTRTSVETPFQLLFYLRRTEEELDLGSRHQLATQYSLHDEQQLDTEPVLTTDPIVAIFVEAHGIMALRTVFVFLFTWPNICSPSREAIPSFSDYSHGSLALQLRSPEMSPYKICTIRIGGGLFLSE